MLAALLVGIGLSNQVLDNIPEPGVEESPIPAQDLLLGNLIPADSKKFF